MLRGRLRRWLVRYGRENIWLVTPYWISDTGLTTAANPDFAGRTRDVEEFRRFLSAATPQVAQAR